MKERIDEKKNKETQREIEKDPVFRIFLKFFASLHAVLRTGRATLQTWASISSYNHFLKNTRDSPLYVSTFEGNKWDR